MSSSAQSGWGSDKSKSKQPVHVVITQPDDDDGAPSENDTVGTLLADIANAINDTLRILMFADKTLWDTDEFEQVRAVEDTLDEAKRDFQELGPLVKGAFYYESDRRPESLDELRLLRTNLSLHTQTFKDWLRQGGPINPLWANETLDLRRELHRAQRRAAARIFASQQADIAAGGPGHRCLGAFEVYRRKRELDEQIREQIAQAGQRTSKYESTRDEIAQGKPKRVPSWQQTPSMADAMEMGQIGSPDGQDKEQQQPKQQQQQQQHYSHQPDPVVQEAKVDTTLEELVPVCNAIGHFERFGDRDVAFACDFCDGFIVWDDLMKMPAERDPLAVASGVTDQPNWQAKGKSVSTGEDKTVVYAPLPIANHIGPDVGDWQARLLCPYCDEYKYYEAGDEDDTRYAQDERGFSSLKEFQEHLEWYHTSVAMPAAAKNCVVM